jgi:hypothetical protein
MTPIVLVDSLVAGALGEAARQFVGCFYVVKGVFVKCW